MIFAKQQTNPNPHSDARRVAAEADGRGGEIVKL